MAASSKLLADATAAAAPSAEASATAATNFAKMQEKMQQEFEKRFAALDKAKKDEEMKTGHVDPGIFIGLLPIAKDFVPLEEGSPKEKVAFRLYKMLQHWNRAEEKVTFTFQDLATYTSEVGDVDLLDEILTDLLGEALYVWVKRDDDRSLQSFPAQCTVEIIQQLAFWGGKCVGESTAKEVTDAYNHILSDNKRRKTAGGVVHQ